VEPYLGPGQTIVMDLSQVTFADSTLIKVLVRARGELTAAGGSLLLRNPSAQARRLLTFGELERLVQDEADRQNGAP
jgi:anti-anti-sigma factor